MFTFFEAVENSALALLDTLFPPEKPLTALCRIMPPPPPKVPKTERIDGFLLGTDLQSSQPVYAMSEQLDRHMLIIGGTGCGKSTLIARLFTEEILKWR